MTSENVPVDWRISSFCDSSACVEVGFVADEVHVRHANQPQPALIFTRAEWTTFVLSVKASEFDQ